MNQVIIKILHTAGLKLTLEERPDILRFLKVGMGQLIGQHIALSGIALRQTFTNGNLALTLNIAVRSVKVCKSRPHESVDHLTKLRVIHLAVHHRKAHTAKAKVFHI